MIIKSLGIDWLMIRFFDYIDFRGKSDNFHIELTKATLRKYEVNPAKELVKEFNIFSVRSKTPYLKSTAYYYANRNRLGSADALFATKVNQLDWQSGHLDFNQLLFLYEYTKNYGQLPEPLDLNKIKIGQSAHKRLLVHLILLRAGKIDKITVVSDQDCFFKMDLEELVEQNSFEEEGRNGSSHEFGYYINYLLDFYELSAESEIAEWLDGLFEKLHKIFVVKKVYYHDLVGKDKTKINISGLILMAKAMFRYSECSGDLRYTNIGLYLVDVVKKLQLVNRGFIQNSLPIYRGNSKLKFPSWTLNYFLETLLLKKKLLHEIKNSHFNKLSAGG